MTSSVRRVLVATTLVAGGIAAGATADSLWIHHSAATPPTVSVPSQPTHAAPPPARTPTPAPPAWVANYTVVSGDTMSGIADADNTTLAHLESVNPQITTPGLIHAGDIVHLPNQLARTPVRLPQPVQRACDGNMALREGAFQGFMGHQSVAIVVTNNATESCTLDGYPTVGLGSPDGTITAIAIQGGGQSTQSAALPVTLGAGRSAQFRLEWSDVTADSPGCVTATTLNVVLPGQHAGETASVAAMPVQPCPGFESTTPEFHVGPIIGLGE